MTPADAASTAASSSAPRPRDHVPPLLRGLGFALVMLAGLVGGVMEHRGQVEVRARMADTRIRLDAAAAGASNGRDSLAIARELRLLRLQLQQQQEDDFSDRLLENPVFQLLGSLGSALVAASFLVEARAKWPRRADGHAVPSSGA
jgi:hypothetical protein